MSESRKCSTGVKQNQRKKGKTPSFYGGLKSQNELYFQMVSLVKEASKGSKTVSLQWIDRIMASTQSKTSGSIF